MLAILTSLVVLATTTLKVGQEILIDLVATPSLKELATARQLLDGSLAPHLAPRLAKAKNVDVELAAVHDCTCFGSEVKAGKVAAKVTFQGAQSEAEKLDLAQALIEGRLVSARLEGEDADEDAPVAPAADSSEQDARIAELEAENAALRAQLEAATQDEDPPTEDPPADPPGDSNAPALS